MHSNICTNANKSTQTHRAIFQKHTHTHTHRHPKNSASAHGKWCLHKCCFHLIPLYTTWSISCRWLICESFLVSLIAAVVKSDIGCRGMTSVDVGITRGVHSKRATWSTVELKCSVPTHSPNLAHESRSVSMCTPAVGNHNAIVAFSILLGMLFGTRLLNS